MMSYRWIVWTAVCGLLVCGLAWVRPASAFWMAQNLSTGQTSYFTNVECDDPDGFMHWRDHTITWRMNASTATPSRVGALGRALASWTEVSGSDYVLSYGGTTLGGFNVDGTNTLTYASQELCVGTCLAITAVVLRSGQEIVEADIAVRPDIEWSYAGNTDNDVEAMMVHELGHSLGIDHNNGLPGGQTMHGDHQGMAGRSLEEDDREALRCSVDRYGIDRPGTDVTYLAYVSWRGWQQQVQNGATAGTTGEGRRMEAAQLRIANGPSEMGICYQAHVKGKGWMTPSCDGKETGTIGENRRMEAIRIWLTRFPQGCSIEYRAHVRGLGWLDWVQYSQVAGTVGEGRRMEALEVRLLGSC